MTTASYHRPDTINEALGLLGDGTAVALAGGTDLLASATRPATSLVDLQALGLDDLTIEGGTARLGAMVRLDVVADHPVLPNLVRHAARAELPSTLRSLATVGGTVATRSQDSQLLGALLAFGADVHIVGGEVRTIGDVVGDGLATGELIEAVSFPTSGRTVCHVVGRTPGDTPIVGVYARTVDDTVTVAATGVADRPCLVDTADLDALDPPGDFRGSADYRRHLARTLVARTIEELGA